MQVVRTKSVDIARLYTRYVGFLSHQLQVTQGHIVAIEATVHPPTLRVAGKCTCTCVTTCVCPSTPLPSCVRLLH